MGAANFDQIVETDQDAKTAYSDAVDQARGEYGYDPYNGTISTTEGFRIVQETPVTLEEAYEIVNRTQDDFSKWGPCGAIALCTEDKTVVRKATGKFVLKAGEAVKDVAVRAVKLKPKEHMTNGSLRIGKILRKHKVSVRATTGAVEKRYFVLGPNPDLRWEKGHPTLSAARAQMVALMPTETTLESPRHSPYPPDCSYEIIGITRRANGEGLVVGSTKLVSSTMEFEADLYAKPGPGAERTGWMFFGWVAT